MEVIKPCLENVGQRTKIGTVIGDEGMKEAAGENFAVFFRPMARS